MPENPNAKLEAFDKRQDQELTWRENLVQKTAQPSFGYCAESGIWGNGGFQHDAAPTLDETEGSSDPDDFE